MATQTDADDDVTESFEMVEHHQETVPKLLLHAVPTTSVAPTSSRASDPVDRSSRPSAGSVLPVTSQPERLERLTTEDIADRLHSHGTGTKNVLPGCVAAVLCALRYLPIPHSWVGLTENDGNFRGPSKLQGTKLQDMKMTDQKWRQGVKLQKKKYSVNRDNITLKCAVFCCC